MPFTPHVCRYCGHPPVTYSKNCPACGQYNAWGSNRPMVIRSGKRTTNITLDSIERTPDRF